MSGLDGRVALITGGAGGQGRAHALRLARDGADVVVIDVTAGLETTGYPTPGADDLAATAAGVEALGRRAIAIEADVRSPEALDAVVERTLRELGRIDILVANAGIWMTQPFWTLSEQQWSEVIDINLSGVWRSAKAVAPHMIERGSGAIVMTASVAGFETAANGAHYAASKHGVLGLMKTVALELAPHGIRVNAVCPGAVDSGMTNWSGAYDLFAGRPGGTREDLHRAGRSFHALRDAGILPPEAIADAVAWLVSDEAGMITGVALPVDAGHLLMPGHRRG